MAYKKNSNMPIVHCTIDDDRVYLSEIRWFDNVPCCDRAKYRSVEWIFKVDGVQAYTTGAVAYDAEIEGLGEGSTYKQINLGTAGIKEFLEAEGTIIGDDAVIGVCVKVQNGCDLVKEKECELPTADLTCCDGSGGGGCADQYIPQKSIIISDVIGTSGPFTILAPAEGEVYLPSVKLIANGSPQGCGAPTFGYSLVVNDDGSVDATTTGNWGEVGDPCTIMLEHSVKVSC